MNKPVISKVRYSPNDEYWEVCWNLKNQDHLDNFEDITHWDIYRNEGGTWIKVGTRLREDTNNSYYVFTDTLDNTPFAHPNYYKIKGVYATHSNPLPETDFSDEHKTQHVFASLGLGNTVNVFVTPYRIGGVMSTGTVKVWKGDANNHRITHVVDLVMNEPYSSYTEDINQYTHYVADIDFPIYPPIIFNWMILETTVMGFSWRGFPKELYFQSNGLWEITDNVDWLSYSQTSGSQTATVEVNPDDFVDRHGPRTREAQITLSMDGVTNTVRVYQTNKYDDH